MPNYNPPQNLVQVAFDAYNAPIQSSILQSEAILKRQEVQQNAMDLQNQMGFQQDMNKLFPGGVDAVDPNDPQSITKLTMASFDAFKRGMPQVGQSMLNGVANMQYKQVEMRKFEQQTQWRNWQETGAAFGAASDDASEAQALSLAQQNHVDLSRYPLTGHYKDDAPYLQQIANSSMSRSQQLRNQYQQESLGERQSQDQFNNSMKIQQYNRQMQELSIHQAMADLRAHHQAFYEGERAKDDARKQEGIDLKKLQSEDRTYANASKVTNDDRTIAQGIMATDDRTSSLSPEMQKSLASLASQRAKIAIANRMRDNGEVEWQPQDFEDELAVQMDAMAREGLFGLGDKTTQFHPPKAPTPQKQEAKTMKSMQDDPKVQAILNNPNLSQPDKVKQIHALGY